MDILAEEVDRILNSPYPTQLKTLHGIIIDIDEQDIFSWQRSHPCQTHSLASVIVEALSQWPYVLDIVARLSLLVEFRDAFLQTEPLLLSQVVDQAVGHPHDNGRYTTLAIALLSHPLSHDTSVPASAQTLLMQLFERASSHPTAEHLYSIHSVLKGACGPIVGIISSSTMSQLEQHIFSILRNTNGVEDQSLGLYCLSIMQLLLQQHFVVNTSPEDSFPSPASSQEPSHAGRWKSDAMAQFFKGSKTHKTMQLVALRVLWACRLESENRGQEAHTSVVLANQIVHGIADDICADWCSKNSTIARKLQEKSMLPDMDAALRFQILTFLGALSARLELGSRATQFYGNFLIDTSKHTCGQVRDENFACNSLKRFASSFDQIWAQTLLERVFLAAGETDAYKSPQSCQTLTQLLRNLASIIDDTPHLRRGLLVALAEPGLRSGMNSFLDSNMDRTHFAVSRNAGMCDTAMSDLRSRLRSALCELLLRAALSKHEHQLPSQLVAGLLRRHTGHDEHHVNCSCVRRVKRVTAHQGIFVDVEGTPNSTEARSGWRERLTNVVKTQARHQQQAVMDAFVAICHDLEERCHHVEEPLRKEQEKNTELQDRLDKLGHAYGELEATIMDRDLHLSALEAENERHATSLEAVSTEAQSRIQRVERAADDLRQVHEDVRIALAVAKQERHDFEIEQTAAMACLQESHDLARDESRALKKQIQDLRVDAEGMEAMRTSDLAETERLTVALHNIEAQLENARENLLKAEAEQRSFMNQHKALNDDVSLLRQELDTKLHENIALNATMEEIKQQSVEDLRTTREAYERALDSAKQDHADLLSKAERQITELHDQLVQAEEDHHASQEAHREKVAELRKRVERLTKECSKKDAQVVEAQEMRNRLMSALGLTGGLPEHPQKPSTLPYRSTSATLTPTPAVPITPARVHGRSFVDDNDDTPASIALSTNGPTPKRARPRQSTHLMNDQQARTSLGGRSAKSIIRTRSAMKRQPLLDIHPNRSPIRSARSPSKVAFKDAQGGTGISTAEGGDLEDWSFTTDCVTGTPGIALQAAQDCLDEESTADV